MYPAEPRIISAAQFFLTCGLGTTQVLTLVDFRVDSDDVFFTGSLIEGFGNSLSDVDVLVVTELPRRHAIRLLPGTRRWVDIVYISRDQLATQMDSVPDLPLGYSDWGNARPASLSALDVLHDFAYGLPVSRPWRTAESIIRDGVKSKIARSWTLTNIISARARWHDACGALQDGQHMQSVYLRSLCLGHCVDAYTGLLGETDINVKWRWSKLTRLARSGRDVLGLHDSHMRHCNVDEFTWAEVAVLLLDVISLFVTGVRFEAPIPERNGERFEITCGRWVKVAVDGLSHEVKAPPHLS